MGEVPASVGALLAVNRAELIERLLDLDSGRACTHREPEDFPVHRQSVDVPILVTGFVLLMTPGKLARLYRPS